MIYSFVDGILAIDLEKIDVHTLTVGLISMEELQKIYLKLGFSISTVRECAAGHNAYRSSMDVYEDYSFGIVNHINVKHIFGPRVRFGFYIRQNMFLVVVIQDNKHVLEKNMVDILSKIKPESVTLERLLVQFFDRLTCNDSIVLEKLGYEISLLEDEIVGGNVNSNFHVELLNRKKELLILRTYYEQLIDLGELLTEDENNIFEKAPLRYLKIYTDRIGRLSNNAQLLRENLVQLREAYQACLDYHLNMNMKVFTGFTVIFSPLTLLVGWYGMNFKSMPEFFWKYGYLFVIILAIVIVICCLWLFRRKKLFD